MNIKKAWNECKIDEKREITMFQRKRQILLGTKRDPHYYAKDNWVNEDIFIKNAVSIPFRSDVRKPIKIILIGASRIGKTTLASNKLDDLQNDFNVPTVTIYPKGTDSVYHNKVGSGKFLCPGEYNRALRNRIFVPNYICTNVPKEMSKGMTPFAFELYDFDPSSEPGFMEDNVSDYNGGIYTHLSILFHKYPQLKSMSAENFLKAIDEYTYQSKKNRKRDYDELHYIPMASYEALLNRVNGAIAKGVLCDIKPKINTKMIIDDWNKRINHAFTYIYTDSNDPRTQAYTSKIIKTFRKAKRLDNSYRRGRGYRERSAWLIVDDARQIIAESMDSKRYPARKEVEELIYMDGDQGWNALLIYHNASDVPKGVLKEADFIICSRLDKDDSKSLPGEDFQGIVRRLFIKPYYYYNQWAVRSKDGKVRTFYAIDSRVGLK